MKLFKTFAIPIKWPSQFPHDNNSFGGYSTTDQSIMIFKTIKQVKSALPGMLDKQFQIQIQEIGYSISGAQSHVGSLVHASIR